jgi:hypothetical protein|tara:strand:+ start:60 stop:659 length:600 start_codon:yes stop_codon:yes gene_type:complete
MGSPVKILKNPKTSAYHKLKDFILFGNFSWFFVPHIYPPDEGWNLNIKGRVPEDKIKTFDCTDHSFFSHQFLERPGERTKYPMVTSSYLKMVEKVISEILDHNKIKINCFYRINANLVLPMKGHKKNVPHLDHYFKHNILLIYLTDAGGETVCADNNLKEIATFDPPEDGVMLFKATNQIHYHYLPENKPRIIIMASHI